MWGRSSGGRERSGPGGAEVEGDESIVFGLMVRGVGEVVVAWLNIGLAF